MLLTATNEILELTTDAAVSTDWSVGYTDITTTDFTPGSGQGNVASATTTTIVSAPAASTQRQIKSITVRNRHATSTQTVTIKKDVAATEYHMTPTIAMLPGETLTYFDGVGFHLLGSTGLVKHQRMNLESVPTLTTPHHFTAGSTGTGTSLGTTVYSAYMGKAPRDGITSIQMVYRITVAAVTITWAEIALAKGAIAPNLISEGNLITLGYTDVSAIVNSTGIKNTTISLTAGQSLNAGDDVWLIIGNSATTSMSIRVQAVADDSRGFILTNTNTFRPSLAIGEIQHFSNIGTTQPWFAIGY